MNAKWAKVLLSVAIPLLKYCVVIHLVQEFPKKKNKKKHLINPIANRTAKTP